MACKNCMKHRPDLTVVETDTFTCGECGQKYKKSGCGPGGYWEYGGETTEDKTLSHIPLSRILLEKQRRDIVHKIRTLLIDLPVDHDLYCLTGEELDVMQRSREGKNEAV